MTDTKTSPGPWRHRRGLVFDANDVAVCEFAREANGRLIAAAPRLLALLTWFVEQGDDIDQLQPEHGRAVALLAELGD